MVWIFLIVAAILVVVLLCYNKSESNSNNTSSDQEPLKRLSKPNEHAKNLTQPIFHSNDNMSYWLKFKMQNHSDADAIEWLLGRDMSTYDDKGASEIVNSIRRWSKNANVPIEQLKLNFYEGIKENLSNDVTIEQMMESLKSKRIKEAEDFHISPEHTICHFMMEFLSVCLKGDDEIEIEEEIKSRALEIFERIIPESRRAEMNQDIAWLISDQMIQMLLSGKIDEKIKQSLPHNAKNKIQDFISFCSSNDVSKESLADLLDVVQQDFISKFDE